MSVWPGGYTQILTKLFSALIVKRNLYRRCKLKNRMIEKNTKTREMRTFTHRHIKIVTIIILLAECVLLVGTALADPTEKKPPVTTNKFEDVTEKMGFTGFVDSAPFWAVSWGDYDNDGNTLAGRN